jgi:hypothetical protein
MARTGALNYRQLNGETRSPSMLATGCTDAVHRWMQRRFRNGSSSAGPEPVASIDVTPTNRALYSDVTVYQRVRDWIK